MLDHWLRHHACTLINVNLCASAGVEPRLLANNHYQQSLQLMIGSAPQGSAPGQQAIKRHSILLLFSRNVHSTDGNGYVDFNEFVIAMNILSLGDSKEKFENTFKMYDIDGDGMITSKEIAKIIEVGVCCVACMPFLNLFLLAAVHVNWRLAKIQVSSLRIITMFIEHCFVVSALLTADILVGADEWTHVLRS
jgi:hypothetical protein